MFAYFSWVVWNKRAGSGQRGKCTAILYTAWRDRGWMGNTALGRYIHYFLFKPPWDGCRRGRVASTYNHDVGETYTRGWEALSGRGRRWEYVDVMNEKQRIIAPLNHIPTRS